jgi:hypothetical protein
MTLKSCTYATETYNPDFITTESFLDAIGGGNLEKAYTHLQNLHNTKTYQIGLRCLCHAHKEQNELTQAALLAKKLHNNPMSNMTIEAIYKVSVESQLFNLAFHILTAQLSGSFQKAQYLGFCISAMKHCSSKQANTFISKLPLEPFQQRTIQAMRKFQQK